MRMMRALVRGHMALVASLLLAGCESALYGVGSLYIWNGTEDKVEFTISGRSTADASLKFEQGQLFEEMVAGEYTITPIKDGVPLMPIKTTVTKDRMSVVNFNKAGCFARADVSGMYVRGKAPARVLETYRDREVLELQDDIPVKPGKRLPTSAPRITPEHVYQRLVVVPCALLDPPKEGEPEDTVAEFVRRLR